MIELNEIDWKISTVRRDDSRTLIAMVYRDEPEKFDLRGLAGCREGSLAENGREFFRRRKEPITQTKREFVKKHFRLRISELNIVPDEKYNRIGNSYVNALIKSAFKTLREKHAAEKQTLFDEIMIAEEKCC